MTSNKAEGIVEVDEVKGTFRVARRVFTDPEILAIERREIFDKCWLYIGHESEVQKPGQYNLRMAGGHEVIFNRDQSGKINAFLNSCPHRGARLCTEKSGSKPLFYCYYHGWAFGSNGDLSKLPNREAFAANFNENGSANMKAVPKLDEYRGFYFVCFDPNAVSLSDYLGEAKAYIDLCLDQGEAGMEVVPGTHEYASSANWKTVVENAVDGNHLASLHSSYLDYVKEVDPSLRAPKVGGPQTDPSAGFQRDLGNGHSVVEFPVPWGRIAGKWWPAWGEETKPDLAANFQKLSARLGKEKATRIANISRNLIIFPNLAIVDGTGLTLRVAHPDATGYMTISSYALAEKGESETLRRLRLAAFVEFLGPGGLATPDDIEALQQCQRAYESQVGLQTYNDISKGSLTAKEWPFDQDGTVRCFWRQWAQRTAVHHEGADA